MSADVIVMCVVCAVAIPALMLADFALAVLVGKALRGRAPR